MKGIIQISLVAAALVGTGLIMSPMAMADCCEKQKSSMGPGVTEYSYRTSESSMPVTTTRSVMVESPVILENRTIERQVIRERVPVYITRRTSHKPVRHYTSNRISHVKHNQARIISNNTTITRTIEKPIIVERPFIVDRVVDRPVYVDRVVEKPVVIERRVVSSPVVIEKRVSQPVMMERRVIDQPIIIEKQKRHLLNLHVL